MSDTPTFMNESVKELVAIGAAMASNCEPCFRYHHDLARSLGVSRADMLEAVNVALAVKAAPHKRVVATAERYLAEGDRKPEESETCGCGAGGCR